VTACRPLLRFEAYGETGRSWAEADMLRYTPKNSFNLNIILSGFLFYAQIDAGQRSFMTGLIDTTTEILGTCEICDVGYCANRFKKRACAVLSCHAKTNTEINYG